MTTARRYTEGRQDLNAGTFILIARAKQKEAAESGKQRMKRGSGVLLGGRALKPMAPSFAYLFQEPRRSFDLVADAALAHVVTLGVVNLTLNMRGKGEGNYSSALFLF